MLVATSNLIIAQEAPTTWEPKSAPYVDLKDLGIAKIISKDADSKLLGIIVPQMLEQSYEIDSPVTETRTRSVTDDKTGETRDEDYSVVLTIKELRTRNVFRSSKREVPLENIVAWSFAGKKMNEKEIEAIFATARPCFIYMPFLKSPPEYVGDPFYNQILRPDAIVIWYDESKTAAVTVSKDSVKPPPTPVPSKLNK